MIRYMTVLPGSHGPAEMPRDRSHAGQRSQRSEVRGPIALLDAFYSGPCTALMADLILKSHTILGFPSCGLLHTGQLRGRRQQEMNPGQHT